MAAAIAALLGGGAGLSPEQLAEIRRRRPGRRRTLSGSKLAKKKRLARNARNARSASSRKRNRT